MSRNTEGKYVAMLEERKLVGTEPTTIITRDGRKGNGKLRYRILPIQGAIDRCYETKLAQLKLRQDAARYNAGKGRT